MFAILSGIWRNISRALTPSVSRNDPVFEAAGVPNGEQPKYFMLNLVYAAGVIETPSRITRRWRYEAHPLRSEAKHNICRLIYHSAHLTPLPTCLLRSHPPRIRIPVSVTTTECFSFSELKARIIQAILAALAKFPSYLIRGTDILGCVMRNYYVFTPVFFSLCFSPTF